MSDRKKEEDDAADDGGFSCYAFAHHLRKRNVPTTCFGRETSNRMAKEALKCQPTSTQPNPLADCDVLERCAR